MTHPESQAEHDNRTEFEKWYRSGHTVSLARSRKENYVWAGPSSAWKAWQASRAALPPVASDADKLRRLREGLDKFGWCAEFGALAAEVLRDGAPVAAVPDEWRSCRLSQRRLC
jgi:hypothetical protein